MYRQVWGGYFLKENNWVVSILFFQNHSSLVIWKKLIAKNHFDLGF
jgi:hypothetical protein